MIPPESTTTTLDAMHAAIVHALLEHFGDSIARYGAYELEDQFTGEATEEIVTPALLLELEGWDEEMMETPDPWGRWAVRCTWVVHCMLGFSTPNLQATLPQLAAVVGTLVKPTQRGSRERGNQWGLGPAVEYPDSVSGQPGGFRPGLHGVDSWVCRWDQVAYLSETAK